MKPAIVDATKIAIHVRGRFIFSPSARGDIGDDCHAKQRSAEPNHIHFERSASGSISLIDPAATRWVCAANGVW
jgi:hypothetical protein